MGNILSTCTKYCNNFKEKKISKYNKIYYKNKFKKHRAKINYEKDMILYK